MTNFLSFPRRIEGPGSTPRSPTEKTLSTKSRTMTPLRLRLTGLGRRDSLTPSMKQLPTTRANMLPKSRKQRFSTKLMQLPRERLPWRTSPAPKMASSRISLNEQLQVDHQPKTSFLIVGMTNTYSQVVQSRYNRHWIKKMCFRFGS